MDTQTIGAILVFALGIISLIAARQIKRAEALKLKGEQTLLSVDAANTALTSVVSALKPLKEEVSSLHEEVGLLRKSNTDLQFEVSELKKENKNLLTENKKLSAAISKLRVLIQQAANGTRLFSMVEYTSDGVLIEDPNRRVSLVNKTFCDMFDIPVEPEDLIGLDCTQAAYNLTTIDDIDAFVLSIDGLIAEWVPVTDEPIKLSDGTILYRSFIPLDHLDGTREIAWIYKLNCK